MEIRSKYILKKKNKFKKYEDFSVDKAYKMKKNNTKDSNGIIKFYDPKIIRRVVNKSIDFRFKKLLELMASIEESDEDPGDGLLFCLDETDKFRHELINKYERFLKKEQMEFLNKKIKLIEEELKNKLLAYRLLHSNMFMNNPVFTNDSYDEETEYEEEHHRKR